MLIKEEIRRRIKGGGGRATERERERDHTAEKRPPVKMSSYYR